MLEGTTEDISSNFVPIKSEPAENYTERPLLNPETNGGEIIVEYPDDFVLGPDYQDSDPLLTEEEVVEDDREEGAEEQRPGVASEDNTQNSVEGQENTTIARGRKCKKNLNKWKCN